MTGTFHLTLPLALPSPSPNLPLCKAFFHTSNRHAPQSGLRKEPVVVWKANKLYGRTSGQSRSHLYPEGRGQERWRCTYHNKQLAPFLPRFYPAFTLMAPINRFYPAFTLMAPINLFYPVFTLFLPRSGG